MDLDVLMMLDIDIADEKSIVGKVYYPMHDLLLRVEGEGLGQPPADLGDGRTSDSAARHRQLRVLGPGHHRGLRGLYRDRLDRDCGHNHT